jgi:hypothetical protein
MHSGNLLMEQEHEKKLKEIIGDIKCPKDFKCCKQGFKNLCKAGDIGPGGTIKCLEKRAYDCSFTTLYNGVFYCTCPLRVYIAKKLKK